MNLVNSGVQTEETELMLPCEDHSNPIYSDRQYIHQSRLGTSLHSLSVIRSQSSSCMSTGTKNCIFIFLGLIGFCSFGLIIFAYYCTGVNSLCSIPSHRYNKLLKFITTDVIGQPLETASKYSNLPTFEEVVSRDFQFDIHGHDVIVFLHMQKTGGTIFGKHLVIDLELERDCVCHRRIKKRCTCLRPGTNSEETWLFSRYSTGWKCGLHADWTELTGCVDEAMDKIEDQSVKRRYFYITLLRDPIHRFLSEFRHVQRGATWRNSLLLCKGRPPSEGEVPWCYKGEDWEDVSLEEFVSCESNLAINRQTRMLADLALVNCYNTKSMTKKERGDILLASAKANLHKMAFFGLTEFQEKSQYLFEETFNLRFKIRFEQFNISRADDVLEELSPELRKKVLELNNLDIQLYEYARKLLFHRFQKLKKMDRHFKEHMDGMGHAHSHWESDEQN